MMVGEKVEGWSGQRRGCECCKMLAMAMRPCRVVLDSWCCCEYVWSYNARLAARPTLPNSCDVVKAHLPASFWAMLGSSWLVCSACWMVWMMWRTLSGQGLIVTCDSVRCMYTP